MLYGFPFSARGKLGNSQNPTGSKNDSAKNPGFPVLAPRIVLGFIGAAVVYLGLKFILPGTDSLLSGIPVLEGFYELGRFIRYGLLGFWASAGAPRVFKQIGLAPVIKRSAADENNSVHDSE